MRLTISSIRAEFEIKKIINCSHVERALVFIKKLVKYYSLLGALNGVMLVTKPILANDGTLPMETLPAFDHSKHRAFFWLSYLNQAGNDFFAGGSNVAVNLFVYCVLVCIEFAVNVLGDRLKRLGHSVESRKPAHGNDGRNYSELIEDVRFHIEIEE